MSSTSLDQFEGKTLNWKLSDVAVEVELHQAPCNEIGTATLTDLESLAEALKQLESKAKALILFSSRSAGFSAGADLRELYQGLQGKDENSRQQGVRDFLERIHSVFNRIDASPLVTVAAVHGVVFGGGFELALTCDMIVADRTARFCFPELRLGFIPGFGGIPRLKRDLGNGLVRDLLLTGRSINASKASAVGLVSQLVSSWVDWFLASVFLIGCVPHMNRFSPVLCVAFRSAPPPFGDEPSSNGQPFRHDA